MITNKFNQLKGFTNKTKGFTNKTKYIIQNKNIHF